MHDAYFIPFTLTPYATPEERLGAQASPVFGTLPTAYAHALRQNERFGNYPLRRNDGAVLTTDFVPERTASGLPVVYTDAVATLTRAEALQRAAALRAAFSGSQAGATALLPTGESGASQAYMLMVVLLPLPG